jgi:hypothetical protein
MTRNPIASNVHVLLLSTILAACGGSAGSSSGTVIGPAGGTVKAAGVTLTVAPGAVKSPTEFQILEDHPKDGASRRIEIEPKDLPLAAPSKLHIEVEKEDSSTMKMVEMEGAESETEVEHGIETEVDDHADNAREAEIEHTGTFEVREAKVCDPACASGSHCDDGVCKPNP